MESIVNFFISFGLYCKEAHYGKFIFWFIPIVTLFLIWLFALGKLKLFNKKEKLKSVFLIHKAFIISSLIVAMILVAIICYCRSKNIFAEEKLELAFLISLIIAFIVPIVSFLVLREYWEKNKVNEITNQSISAYQAHNQIPFLNKSFNKNKIYYLLPFIGFLFLLFSLNSGINLISIVFDNSGSMDFSNSYTALNKTFSKLDNNNQIIITTLNGLDEHWDGKKETMNDIMDTKSSSKLKAGRNFSHPTPLDAKNNLMQVLQSNDIVYGSPICEAIWKMWLFTKEEKANTNYQNKLLILITDGDDNCIKDVNNISQIQPANGEDGKTTAWGSSKFFYDNDEFVEYFTPENTYIIDYSPGGSSVLINKFENEGATVYPAITSVDDYLDALSEVLHSFQNDKYLIAWTIAICLIFTIIGLLIFPKKIMI